MRKYGHWRKLPVKAVAVVGGLLIGCGDTTHLNSEVAPVFITVEELAANYEDRIGDTVILEGVLAATENGQYFLGAKMENRGKSEIQGFRVALIFESGNVSDDRMIRCLSGPTLVTGLLQGSREIKVKYVKLLSDTRVHRTDSCYHYLD